MNVLAIETSAIYCSNAVFKDGQIFFKEDTNKTQHGKVILALIDELLDQSQLSLEQLDKILIRKKPTQINWKVWISQLKSGGSVPSGGKPLEMKKSIKLRNPF